MAQRETPKEWPNYVTASTSINLLHLQNTPPARRLLERGYIDDRRPGDMIFAENRKMENQMTRLIKQACYAKANCFLVSYY